MLPIRAIAVAVFAATLFGFWAPARADTRWWRDGPTTQLDSPATLKACAVLSNKASGDDRIGCAITAIFAGRTALASDYFLVVTDADARACIPHSSTFAAHASPAQVLMAAYCEAKEGEFSNSRLLVNSLKAVGIKDVTRDFSLRFEAFRTAILAQAANGEGDADAAIKLILDQPQLATSDVLQASLFEIYIEDERHDALLAWSTDQKANKAADPILSALYLAQTDLVRGLLDKARRDLEAVPTSPGQDGSKTLEVARYRVAHMSGNSSSNNSTKDPKGRMFIGETATFTPGQGIQATNGLSLSLAYANNDWGIAAKGINFNIDKDKLMRPGDALPIGFFY